MYIIMKSFADGVERIKKEHPRLYSICKLLQDVFALYFIDKEFGDFAGAKKALPPSFSLRYSH